MGVGDDEIFSAAFGGSSSNTAEGTRADSRHTNDNDPLSQLWLPPPPAVVPGPLGGNGDGGLAGSGTTPLPAEQAPLSDDDERVSGSQERCVVCPYI